MEFPSGRYKCYQLVAVDLNAQLSIYSFEEVQFHMVG